MNYEVAEDKKFPGEWRVEAINESGDIFVSLFAGPDAELRAREYAALKTTPPQTQTCKLCANEAAVPYAYGLGASCLKKAVGAYLYEQPIAALPTPPEEEKA